jgi:hypothetical protein
MTFKSKLTLCNKSQTSFALILKSLLLFQIFRINSSHIKNYIILEEFLNFFSDPFNSFEFLQISRAKHLTNCEFSKTDANLIFFRELRLWFCYLIVKLSYIREIFMSILPILRTRQWNNNSKQSIRVIK